jgi:hypothetical protein
MVFCFYAVFGGDEGINLLKAGWKSYTGEEYGEGIAALIPIKKEFSSGWFLCAEFHVRIVRVLNLQEEGRPLVSETQRPSRVDTLVLSWPF